VIRHEETGFLRIEARRANDANLCARKKHDATAKSALEPIVLLGIKYDSQRDQGWDDNREMQKTHGPEKCAAKNVPCALHM
jgi:hypothetical protein